MAPGHVPDLSAFNESGLFSLYRAILGELKSRDVIRTENAPVGDYAEYLMKTALGGRLASNSEKSWDVLGKDGEKLQVKARVVSDPPEPGQLQLSPFPVVRLRLRSDRTAVSCRLHRREGVESASPRHRVFCGIPAARKRQGLARPP